MTNSLNQPAHVLCVDDDHDIGDLIQAILSEEGYIVSCIYEVTGDALARAVGRVEPDAVLLDSASARDYDAAWGLAAGLGDRPRQVPVVMFTAHDEAAEEAEKRASARAAQADFAAVVRKPFHIDELLAAVATAVGRSEPFDRSRPAETARTQALVKALEEHGATDVRPSQMREWALFRDRKDRLVQLYWWQSRGLYQVGRYSQDGIMKTVGQFVDRDAAIELALAP